MFKYKYKMHKFVNLIFYGIVFVTGFLIGLGFKGVGLNEKIFDIFNTIIS